MNRYLQSAAPWTSVLLVMAAMTSAAMTGCAHNPRDLFSFSRKKTPVTHHGEYQTAMSADEEMTRRIDLALKAADLNGYDIAVQYDEGTAVLGGSVRTRQQKDLASQVVSQIPGIRRVDNRLTSTGHAPTNTYTAARFRRTEGQDAPPNPRARPPLEKDDTEENGLLSFVRTASTSTEDLQDPFLNSVEHADFQEVDGDQADSKIEHIAGRTPQPPMDEPRQESLAARPPARTNPFDATKSFDQIFEEAVGQQENPVEHNAMAQGRHFEEQMPEPADAAGGALLTENSALSESQGSVLSGNLFAEGIAAGQDRSPNPALAENTTDDAQQTEWMNVSRIAALDEGIPPQDAPAANSPASVALAGLQRGRNDYIVESTQVAPRLHASPLLVTGESDSANFGVRGGSDSNPFSEFQAAAVPREGWHSESTSPSEVASNQRRPGESGAESEARLESFSAFRRSVQPSQEVRIHSNSGATVLTVDPSPAGWPRESHIRNRSSAFLPKRAEQLAQLSEALHPDDPAPAPPMSADFDAEAERDPSRPSVATILAPVTFNDEPRTEDVREPMSTGASLVLGMLLLVACLVGVGLRQRLPALRRRLRF